MSYGLSLLRVVVGGTMFSHGAQKLFVGLAHLGSYLDRAPSPRTPAGNPRLSSSGEAVRLPRCANLSHLGVWRSLVARSVRVGEVPSSNLGTPIGTGETM